MEGTDDREISGALTFFPKFVMPPIFLSFALLWVIWMVCIFHPRGDLPALAIMGFLPLAFLSRALGAIVRDVAPLKQVWFDEHGLRVSNFCAAIEIPFDDIEEVRQKTSANLRYVVVSLSTATRFGRRFTFLPRSDRLRLGPSRREDAVVVELRGWIEAAHKKKNVKLLPKLNTRPGRSPMADDELDGTL